MKSNDEFLARFMEDALYGTVKNKDWVTGWLMTNDHRLTVFPEEA